MSAGAIVVSPKNMYFYSDGRIFYEEDGELVLGPEDVSKIKPISDNVALLALGVWYDGIKDEITARIAGRYPTPELVSEVARPVLKGYFDHRPEYFAGNKRRVLLFIAGYNEAGFPKMFAIDTANNKDFVKHPVHPGASTFVVSKAKGDKGVNSFSTNFRDYANQSRDLKDAGYRAFKDLISMYGSNDVGGKVFIEEVRPKLQKVGA